MRIKRQRRGKRRGFLLLEVLVAASIFMIAAVAYAKVLSSLTELSRVQKENLQVQRILSSKLEWAMSLPLDNIDDKGVRYTERDFKELEVVELERAGVELLITPREAIVQETEENGEKDLENIYSVEVKLFYTRDGEEYTETAEVYRYSALYLP